MNHMHNVLNGCWVHIYIISNYQSFTHCVTKSTTYHMTFYTHTHTHTLVFFFWANFCNMAIIKKKLQKTHVVFLGKKMGLCYHILEGKFYRNRYFIEILSKQNFPYQISSTENLFTKINFYY
jgi:hypothetical protein